jgi:hypothetical protein
MGLVMGLSMSLPNLYVDVVTPIPQNVTTFGNRAFEEDIKLKYDCWAGPSPI